MTIDLRNLTAGRLWIISAPPDRSSSSDAPRGQAYLSRALFSLCTVHTDAVPSLSVDEGWRLYVNPDWLATTDVPTIGRELAHVLWHLLNNHAERARACGVTDESAERWHLAADMAIQDLTASSGRAPDHLPEPLTSDDGRCPSAEELFARLLGDERYDGSADGNADRDHTDCGSGADGIPRDYEPAVSAELPVLSRLEAMAVRHDVALGVGGAHPGTRCSSALQRWADSIAPPRVPWQQVLAGAARRSVTTVAGRGDYTYRRPSRRSSSTPGVVLPSQQRPVPQVAVVVDTSGSMDHRMLGRALAELDRILETLQMGENGLQVFTVDTAAYEMSRVRRAVDVDLLGGGGTDMTVGIAAAAMQRPRPELVVVFTDGYTPWPAAPVPGMTVLAALIGPDHHSLPTTPDWIVRVECVGDE